MNIIIITGASSGIGREFALQMDRGFKNIDEFWLVARRGRRLEELADRLGHKARIFPMDITNKEKLDILEDSAFRHNVTVRMLVNCAGYGIRGSFCGQDPDMVLGMVRLNCEALTEITHRMIPYMRPGSRIIQLASSAAFLPQPEFAVYAATKSYVLSFSRALGKELEPAGIYVTSVCPGPVDTPFFEIAEADCPPWRIKDYTMVPADRVVALALRDSYHKRPLSVCSLPIKLFWVLSKIAPAGVLLNAMDLAKRHGRSAR